MNGSSRWSCAPVNHQDSSPFLALLFLASYPYSSPSNLLLFCFMPLVSIKPIEWNWRQSKLATEHKKGKGRLWVSEGNPKFKRLKSSLDRFLSHNSNIDATTSNGSNLNSQVLHHGDAIHKRRIPEPV